MKGLNDILKAAQAAQESMGAMQSKLADMIVEGSSGGGLVKATVNGKGQVQRLFIDPSLFKPEDREVVEDLIVAAIAEAGRKAEAAAQAEMAKLTAGLPLPPGLKLPF
jgi:DNA-binding YbaB/EbfC family protein